MAKQVETMAHVGAAPPWLGQGFEVKQKMTVPQMMKVAKIDWTVSKRGMHFVSDTAGQFKGANILVPREYALVRDSDERVLSTVGETWKPVQNVDSVGFFKKFTEAGKMEMEHMGSLANGQYVWALARIKQADFAVGKEDEVRSYLLMCQPHQHGRSMVFQYTPARSWCWNTLNFILRSSIRGGGAAFRMSHAAAFNDVKKAEAEKALHLVKDQAVEFKALATKLATKKAKPEQVEEFFCEVLRYDPAKANKKKDETEREPRMLPKIRAALTHAPGQQAASALGTWWGAVNAVTFVVDHETGRERQTALRNAWLGNTSSIKRRALDLALQKAK